MANKRQKQYHICGDDDSLNGEREVSEQSSNSTSTFDPNKYKRCKQDYVPFKVTEQRHSSDINKRE